MEEAFNRWLQAHDDAGTPLSRCLRPPVDNGTIDRVRIAVGSMPDDVAELHRLADGVDMPLWNSLSRYAPRLAPGAPEFVDLETAWQTAERMRTAARQAPRQLPADDLWPSALGLAYPILADECVAVDTRESPGQLWMIRWQATEVRGLEGGLEWILDAATERMQRLGCQWDPQTRLLDYDLDLEDELPPFPGD